MPSRDDADNARGEIVIARERGALFFEERDEPLRDVPEADENQIDGHRDATVPEMGVRSRVDFTSFFERKRSFSPGLYWLLG